MSDLVPVPSLALAADRVRAYLLKYPRRGAEYSVSYRSCDEVDIKRQRVRMETALAALVKLPNVDRPIGRPLSHL